MSLKAQPYIFRRFFVMQYLSICRLRPIFISSKFIRMQEMGLIFHKFAGGACPRTPLASLHACGACLLRACVTCRPTCIGPNVTVMHTVPKILAKKMTFRYFLLILLCPIISWRSHFPRLLRE